MKNLNSKLLVGNATIGYAIGKVGFLLNEYRKVPVYFVDESLMDILYPPRKRILLNEECLKELIKRHKDRIKNREYERLKDILNRFYEGLEECKSEYIGIFVAIGVYKRSLTSNELSEIKKASGEKIPNKPSIFICPERVFTHAERISTDLCIHPGKAFDVLFAKILIHELAHAYMDRPDNQYAEVYGPMIEESLANAIAIKPFRRTTEKAIVNGFVINQPVEYRACTLWDNYRAIEVQQFARIWRDNSITEYVPPIFFYRHPREFFYYLEEFYFHYHNLTDWHMRGIAHEAIEGIRDFYGTLHGPEIPDLIIDAVRKNDTAFFWKMLALRLKFEVLGV